MPAKKDTYIYYKEEDGACCLSNPVVWKSLSEYVGRRIHFCFWINNKSFCEASDILMDVYLETKEIEKDITLLIKRINVKIEQAWIVYLKKYDPDYYDWMLEYRRNYHKEYAKRPPSERVKATKARHNKAQQTKLREEITDDYLLQMIYHDIKNKTGEKLTFDQIRTKHPDKIKQKREDVIKHRSYKTLKERLEPLVGKNVRYGLSEFTITKAVIKRNKNTVLIYRSDFDEPFTKNIFTGLEFVEELQTS